MVIDMESLLRALPRGQPDEANLLVGGDAFRRRMALVHTLLASGADRLSDEAQVLVRHGETLQACPLAARTSFGKGEDCDVVLPWEGVSDAHCLIGRVNSDWFVEDLHSAGGTYLNEEKVSKALLRDGDVIGVGRGQLIFLSSLPAPGKERHA